LKVQIRLPAAPTVQIDADRGLIKTQITGGSRAIAGIRN